MGKQDNETGYGKEHGRRGDKDIFQGRHDIFPGAEGYDKHGGKERGKLQQYPEKRQVVGIERKDDSHHQQIKADVIKA
jgi:hypothetical protein